MSRSFDPGTLCVSAGLALVFLGALLLLSRLAAEAAKIRYDVNLLWTNKFDRCSRFSLDRSYHDGTGRDHKHTVLLGVCQLKVISG